MKLSMGPALLLVAVATGCGDHSAREAGERELSAVTVPAGWTASAVDYQAAGLERRYDQWTVGYRNLAAGEGAVRDSYADALRVVGWDGCAAHDDTVQGDLCKSPFEIVLSTRRSSSCVPATLASCTELTVTLYKVG